jgi:hypothetical protein
MEEGPLASMEYLITSPGLDVLNSRIFTTSTFQDQPVQLGLELPRPRVRICLVSQTQ